MTREEAIRELKADYCGNRIICELYPDQCNREDCEIWWAITALENAKNDNLTPESAQNVPNQAFKMQKSDALGAKTGETCSDTISRQAAIDAVDINRDPVFHNSVDYEATMYDICNLPSAHQTLYGYDIEHLKLIANVLQKENLPPERVADALMDIGRIVAIVRDEFEETLRKAVEQCRI